MTPMVDVRVDHTLIEHAISLLSRYAYLPELRMSQRAPIEELQRVVRAATVERTVTDTSVMVCAGCGYRTDACPECGGTEFENPTTVDADALNSAMSEPLNLEATDCDAPEDQPDPRCRCSRCFENRRRLQAARRAQRVSCLACGLRFRDHTGLADHVVRHNDTCGLCGWEARTTERMEAHRQAYHLRCDVCDRWFRDDAAMEQHREAENRRADEFARFMVGSMGPAPDVATPRPLTISWEDLAAPVGNGSVD